MTTSDPRGVIEGIRAEALESEDDFWRRQMEQTAQHVSEDQYDGPMQFVRELIQNADDSDYPAGVVPEVTIRRTAREFVFESNECGFAADDVRALCGFGGSAKGKDKARFIGEKGLGFKSVFQVADRPEIHSNGFHFRFDKKAHKGLGRAIPEWIDGCEDAPGTRIVLPIRQDAAIPDRDPDDLRAEQWILLFLRKLNTLHYIDVERSRVVELARRVEGETAKLSHRVIVNGTMNQSSERVFLINRTEVDVSGISEAKRAGFAASTVEVAVPINRDRMVRLEDTGVAYAFLPVIETRLRYSLNADLLLVTDRSAPLENPWNKTLCGGLGKCLADVIGSFCGHAADGVLALGLLKHSSAAMRPLYRPMFDSAVAALRARACIPTATDKWVLPSQAVLPDSHGLHALLDPAHLAARAGCELAASSILPVAEEAALLGARELSLVQFLDCLQDHEWIKQRPTEWFGQLYQTLGRITLLHEQKNVLKRLPILRMSDGSTRSPQGPQVFRSEDGGHAYGFEQSMPVIAAAAAGRATWSFLDALGVKRLTPKDVIDDFILPSHRSAERKPLDDETLVAHACYIIDHRQEYERASVARPPLKSIWQNLRILTRAPAGPGRVSPKASKLYLGKTYGDPYDLETIWGTRMPARFISPRYAAAPSPRQTNRDWGKFFSDLRASTRPGMNPSGKGENPGVAWRQESKELFATQDEANIVHFLSIISKEWAHYAEPIEGRGLDPEQTELVQDLRAIQLGTTKGRVRLDACFLDTPDNRAVFGDDKPYLRSDAVGKVFSSDTFAAICGVVKSPTLLGVLERLRTLSRTGAADSATAEQVRRLYQHLADRRGSWPPALVTAFQTERIVLAGHPSDGWISLKQACWDTGESLASHCPLCELKPRWTQFRDFFVGFLKVPETLTPDAWVQVLESVASSDEPKERAERFVRRAYLQLAAVLSGSDSTGLGAAAVRRMRASALILCKDGYWRGLKTSHATIVFADDPQLEAALAEQSGVAFVALLEEDRDDALPLLRALEIPRLREVARLHVPDGRAESAAPYIAARLRQRVNALARVLYHNHRNEFKRAVADRLFEFLVAADVWRTPAFRVVVGSSSVDCALDAKLLGVGSYLRLFIGARDDGGALWKAIGVALGDELGLPAGVGDNLGGVLDAADAGVLKQTLQRLRVPELPPEALRRLPNTEPDDGSSATASVRHEVVEAFPPASKAHSASEPEMHAVGEISISKEDGTADVAESNATPAGAPLRGAANESGISMVDRKDGASVSTSRVTRDDEQAVEGNGIDVRPASSPSKVSESDFVDHRRAKRIVRRSEQSYAARAMIKSMPVDDALIADVEAKAIEFVLAEERAAGREAIDMNVHKPDNPGYDVRSVDDRTGDVRLIEVKGTSNEWGDDGVDVTPTQVRFSLEHGDAAWLYVVECALDGRERKCFRIQNFAAKIEEFVVDGRLRHLAER